MNTAFTILTLGIIVFLAHWFSSIFERKGVPDVLLLMVVGILVGPVLNLVKPDDFGIAGPMFTSITLIIILFEGGIGMNIPDLRKSVGGAMKLTATNFFVTMIVVALFAYLFLNLSLLASLALGATLGGTSSAVVIPMVRQIKISEVPKNYLILESALSDVLCIVFGLAFIEGISGGEVQPGLIAGKIISSFLLASIVGFASAIAWSSILLNFKAFKTSIFTTPAFVFIVYGIAEMLGYSGAISALVFGITLVNLHSLRSTALKRYISDTPISLNETEKNFFNEMVFLLKTFFFVYIGISLRFDDYFILIIGLLLTSILFVFRIPVVSFSSSSQINLNDRVTMGVMVPKGLAAAVLAGIPLQKGIAGGQIIQDVTYSVVLISIIITSILIPLLDKYARLKTIYAWFFRIRLNFVKAKNVDSDNSDN